MDTDKISEFRKDKTYTDLVLTLSDGTNHIDLDVHKVILAASCEYFHKLFNFAKEKNQNQITMDVSNAEVTKDIIMTFYDIPIDKTKYKEWSYVYHLFRCQKYFGLKCDPSILYNVVVPPNKFEELLECAEDFLNNTKIMNLIKSKLPLNYPFEKLSKEFVKELLEISGYKIAIIREYGEAEIWNFDTHDKITNLVHTKDKTKPVKQKSKKGKSYKNKISDNSENCEDDGSDDDFDDNVDDDCDEPTKSHYKSNKVADSDDEKSEDDDEENISVRKVYFSSDNRFLVTTSHGKISIWDAETYDFITNLNEPKEVLYDMHVSNNGLIAVSHEKSVSIWNLYTMQMVNTLPINDRSINDRNKVILSYGGEHLVVFSNANLKIFNVASLGIEKSISGSNISNVSFSPNGKYLAYTERKYVTVMDTKNYKVYKTFNENNNIGPVIFTNDNNKIIYGDDNGNITFKDFKKKYYTQKINMHGTIYQLFVTSDDKFLLFANGNDIKIIDLTNFDWVGHLDANHWDLRSLAINASCYQELDEKLTKYLHSITM